MKTIWIVIAFSIAQINLQAQMKTTKLHPSEYFDFWLGNWNLSWQGSNNNVGTGENHIFKTLNDHVIEENFKVIDDPNMNGFIGKSWSIYNKNKDTWHQTWVDNQGAYLDFVGEIVGEKRIFKREYIKPDVSKIFQRMVFYNIKENSFTWDWENSADNGETWTLRWRIQYIRK
ncbi:MAG: hypothetical protein C0597_14930 [Marinilabiliales bacterium]|nr:MAG: hypothetical protein C0597_14930 [Marinilabiliales bacterium]